MNWNFVRFHEILIDKMLKISAFYLGKKSFVPKTNMRHFSNRDFKKQNFWFPEFNTCFCSRLYCNAFQLKFSLTFLVLICLYYYYVLKSVHFKNTYICAILISFKIVVLFVLICIEMYHNFERNENRATVFLKWTNFSFLTKSNTF